MNRKICRNFFNFYGQSENIGIFWWSGIRHQFDTASFEWKFTEPNLCWFGINERIPWTFVVEPLPEGRKRRYTRCSRIWNVPWWSQWEFSFPRRVYVPWFEMSVRLSVQFECSKINVWFLVFRFYDSFRRSKINRTDMSRWGHVRNFTAEIYRYDLLKIFWWVPNNKYFSHFHKSSR